MAVLEAAFVGAVSALSVVLVVGASWWAVRAWQQRHHDDFSDAHDHIVTYERTAPVGRRRVRWGGGENSGSSSKGYGEIGKGPDRPARSRMAGKPGMTNRADRATADWRTHHINNRAAGRKDAHKVKSKPARKPKPR